MLNSFRAYASTLRNMRAVPALAQRRGFVTFSAPRQASIKILSDAEEAQEDMYFSKEDEKLIKRLLEANPELAYAADGANAAPSGADSVVNEVKYIFMQHGIPPSANETLIDEIVKLVEKHKK